jgi:chromosome condensin MukBEF MukE localization factor
MPQPFSHAVLQWQVRHQLLEQEREDALTALASARSDADRDRLSEKLRDVERALRALGPDPSAKMG